ncbi:acyl-CoA carboxylase subunit epsilon [Streptomyces kaniharaensis]|uniref:acyl-CoA carboxylase subunit epsilon n=1 Tax=Streptomyces kaniharaensis TaxID=212423 RepID=UPI001294D7AE|nr:acyl-CoA carboxylase subunit epsilon [Streptomyces kaniharaensis]
MSGETVPVLEGPLGPALIRVISGSPTPEELAAVAVLLSTRTPTADRDRAAPPPAARWEAGDILPPASWAARS